MCEPPRVTCTHCRADLGPARLIRAGHAPEAGWVWGWPDTATAHDCPKEPQLTTYTVPDGPKMLRETLCVAQAGISELMRQGVTSAGSSLESHLSRLGRLIDECDRHRPIGPDGKHGDRHTETCGCEVPCAD